MTARHRAISLPCDLASARVARHLVREVLVEWDLADLAEHVGLATTEVVANAVRHARTELSLEISVDRTLHVTVYDGHRETVDPSRVSDPGPFAEGGRGLQILTALVTEWGCHPHGEGKAVWFRLDLPDAVGVDADHYDLADERSARRDARELSGGGDPGHEPAQAGMVG